MGITGRPLRGAVLLCVALLAASGPAPVAAGIGGAANPNPRDVDAAVAFRTKLGLRADRAFVGSTFGKAAFSSADWGVPLDRGESAEVERRKDLQEAVARAFRAWAKEDASAGGYIDQRGGGVAVFLTTGDPARERRGIAKVLPDDGGGGDAAKVRFERVRHSMAELLALQDRINADLAAGVLAPFGVTSTAIDARSNAVALGVDADTAEVRAALVARYGDAIRVAFELPAQGGDAGCNSRTDCPPAKGGIEIRSTYNNNNCTIGFMVRVNGSPQPRLLTAGHCVELSGGTGTSRTWTHHGVNFGWAELSNWTNGADADVALLSPPTGAIAGSRNLVYRASSSDVAGITDWARTADQVAGGLVCRAGVTSGWRCGTIEQTNLTKSVDGRTIDHQWVVDFDGCPGDSGGPYVLGTIAYGIHTDSTTGCDPSKNLAWYSPIGWVTDVLAARGHPVHLCTTATCGSTTNTWTPRAATADAPWDPRLIRLGNGRVLKVGGLVGDQLGASTTAGGDLRPQLYNPTTGQWSDAAAPPWSPAECEGQFATLLGDGRVLVGGGRRVDAGDAAACTGAHLYDPAGGAAGSWSSAAAPPVALVEAGAALLDDGRAFVTGGSGADGATSVALAYTPGSNTWETLAAAPAGARSPLVLRLPDGRVLVTGGYKLADVAAGGLAHVTATQLYDPEADSWSSTTPVGAFGIAGAVLKSGHVVVGGGQHLSWNGAQQSTLKTAVSRFDPSNGSWTPLAALPAARSGFTLAELPNGLLLAAAGRVPGTSPLGQPSRSATAYDPVSKAWYTVPSLVTARAGQGSAVLADGTVLVAGGGTTAAETYAYGDVVPPVAATPSTALRSTSSTATPDLPIRVSWSATDMGGSGVGTYDVARSTDGGSFTSVATKLTGTTFDTTVTSGHTYQFQVRARDWAGNLGAWKQATTVSISLKQQTVATFAGSWTTATYDSYSGDTVKYSKTAGASATYTFTGRGIAWITERGPSRGSAKVYIDGVLATTVSMYSGTAAYRRIGYLKSWSTTGSHTIKIVVVGTSGHPRVDMDAFIVLSTP